MAHQAGRQGTPHQPHIQPEVRGGGGATHSQGADSKAWPCTYTPTATPGRMRRRTSCVMGQWLMQILACTSASQRRSRLQCHTTAAQGNSQKLPAPASGRLLHASGTVRTQPVNGVHCTSHLVLLLCCDSCCCVCVLSGTSTCLVLTHCWPPTMVLVWLPPTPSRRCPLRRASGPVLTWQDWCHQVR